MLYTAIAAGSEYEVGDGDVDADEGSKCRDDSRFGCGRSAARWES